MLTFASNPAAQITSNTRSNDVYAWPGHGNGTTASTHNGLNQLLTQGGVSISHDARGNLTSDGTRTFAYTAENRLAQSGAHQLAYDALGRLFYSAAVGSILDYDGLDLIVERNASNQLTRRYVHGPGVDEPLVWYEIGDTTPRRWLHADERGSIVAITNDAGQAIAVNKYDEYGRPGNNLGRFQYTGQAWLPELQVYYYKERMYDPNLPRFLQLDRTWPADGMNGYTAMGGDPVNFTDPSGMSRIDYYRMYRYFDGGSDYRQSREGRQFASSFFAGSLQTRGYFRPRFVPSNTPTRGIDADNDGQQEEIVVTGGRWVYDYVAGSTVFRDIPSNVWKGVPYPSPTPSDGPKEKPNDFCGRQGVTGALPEGAWQRACQKHDTCYGKSGIPRATCDARFLRDIYSECSSKMGTHVACGTVAILGYSLVRGGGLFFYELSPGRPTSDRW